jgi:hypothetical protein
MSDVVRSPYFSLRIITSILFIGVAAAFLLTSCQKLNEDVLPEGPQTMTGILVPLPISVSRRGTHALMQNGHSTYVVESSTVNLRHFEDVEAIVTGHLEPNIDPESPAVLVASGVTLVEIELRTWTVPAFNLTIDTPPDWNPTFFPDGVRFSQTGSSVILSIHPSSQPALPSGNSHQVAGYPGVVVTGSGMQTLFLRRGAQILTFEYHESVAPSARGDLFLRMLRSVKFTAASSARSATSATTGTGSSTAMGVPCGGPAGVLCPAGQFCEVTDTATNIGHCRALKH